MKTKVSDQNGLTYVTVEISMDTQWPAGDPVPRDKETLVVFAYREQPSPNTDSNLIPLFNRDKETQ